MIGFTKDKLEKLKPHSCSSDIIFADWTNAKIGAMLGLSSGIFVGGLDVLVGASVGSIISVGIGDGVCVLVIGDGVFVVSIGDGVGLIVVCLGIPIAHWFLQPYIISDFFLHGHVAIPMIVRAV